ncbi:MAG: ACT domain-containing protein, partial [Zetaproteobacteria bacterium]
DPYISDARAEAMGVEKVGSLSELAKAADVLTVHVPLTPQTRHLINAEIIAQMKPDAILVNCARGGVVDEEALVEALKNKRIRAAAVDVYEKEPARDHPLFALDNAICTPHIGASTIEAQENVAIQIAEQVAQYLLRGVVRHAVNMPSLPEDEQRRLAPYLDLARRIGRFLGGTMRPGFTRVRIAFEGQAAELPTRPLVHEILCGLLSGAMEEVNPVNAPMIARERGIAVEETTREATGTFASLIRVEVEGDEGQRAVAGTLFDGVRPRFVEVDGCEIEVAPKGSLVLIHNEDRPGVIAAVGKALADANVNIADFRLGRRPGTREAAAVVRVDSPPPETALRAIAEQPFVRLVRYVELEPQR